MKQTGNIFRIITVSVLLLFILILTGCISLNLKPNPGKSVLYIVRQDAVVSKGDIIKVFLNGIEVTEMTPESYVAYHIVPGEYELLYNIYNKDGEEIKKFGFSGTIKPDRIYSHTIVFNFGWKGWEKFDSGGSLMGKLTFLGEIDLTGKLSPR